MKNSLILLAGGIGKRLGNKEPKQFVKFGNTSLIEYFLAHLDKSIFDNIIIAVSDKNRKINIRPIFNLLNNNSYIGITPDGPRGPKEKVSDGVIKIAKKSNVPIIPVGFWSSRNFTLNSWDSFLITYPFSKCVFTWSDPILIPNNLRDEEIPKFQLLIENKINDCIQSAKLDLSV